MPWMSRSAKALTRAWSDCFQKAVQKWSASLRLILRKTPRMKCRCLGKRRSVPLHNTIRSRVRRRSSMIDPDIAVLSLLKKKWQFLHVRLRHVVFPRYRQCNQKKAIKLTSISVAASLHASPSPTVKKVGTVPLLNPRS